MAALKDRLKADRVAAMKARDQVAKDTLAMALTAIQLEEVAGDAALVEALGVNMPLVLVVALFKLGRQAILEHIDDIARHPVQFLG